MREGLQFKGIKVYERGMKNQQFWSFLKDNIRASDMVVGDMEAQISACRTGAVRFLELAKDYGIQKVLAASEYLMAYSEAAIRREIEKLPDGKYEAVGYCDGFQDDPDPRKRDLKIAVAVQVAGSDILVDLSGSSPQID